MKFPKETNRSPAFPMLPIENLCYRYIIGNFKNPLVSSEQLNKQGAIQ